MSYGNDRIFPFLIYLQDETNAFYTWYDCLKKYQIFNIFRCPMVTIEFFPFSSTYKMKPTPFILDNYSYLEEFENFNLTESFFWEERKKNFDNLHYWVNLQTFWWEYFLLNRVTQLSRRHCT